MELRNFATCMAILDGLENLIVKQLPAWKHLPSKCVNIKGALESSRVSGEFLSHFEILNHPMTQNTLKYVGQYFGKILRQVAFILLSKIFHMNSISSFLDTNISLKN